MLLCSRQCNKQRISKRSRYSTVIGWGSIMVVVCARRAWNLLAYYQEVKARGLQIVAVWNHGMALALYVPDPEGNLIEIYWPTGREDYHPRISGRLTWKARRKRACEGLWQKVSRHMIQSSGEVCTCISSSHSATVSTLL